MYRRPIQPSQAAILRSVQKDEQYREKMKNEVHQLLQVILGPRNWIHFKQSIDLASDLTYYGLTTLSGLQTLGEEYVRIVQIEGNKLQMPSIERRLIMVLLSTSGQLMIDSVIKQIGVLMSDVHSLNFIPQLENNSAMREKIINILPEVKSVVTLIQRFHLIWFYFYGHNYEISKRITGVNYTAIRSWLTGSGSEVIYKLLGYVSLAQLLITILMKYYSYKNAVHEQQSVNNRRKTAIKESMSHKLSSSKLPEIEEEPSVADIDATADEEVPQRLKCSLCLCKRTDSTATPCGHLFCWKCIHEWIESKAECPLCRLKFAPSRLVHLQN